MKIIAYDDNVSAAARDFLEDLADEVAGVERCRACFRQFRECDCPELIASGVLPKEAA